ncbi:MAG TPA: hypothetical protein VHI98_02540 [Vicinamibacterales bacterium]|jgi:hypothetical protein|nr:hypothetical protein [Vicinamibacterales bacterium]
MTIAGGRPFSVETGHHQRRRIHVENQGNCWHWRRTHRRHFGEVLGGSERIA